MIRRRLAKSLCSFFSLEQNINSTEGSKTLTMILTQTYRAMESKKSATADNICDEDLYLAATCKNVLTTSSLLLLPELTLLKELKAAPIRLCQVCL